jgi:hypothetical protein
MVLYVDNENKVRAVNTTTDTSLTSLYVDETVESFPFKGWSVAKICCYKVSVSDGVVTMMTPYVDSRMLDMVDTLGHQIDNSTPYKVTKTAYIDDTEIVFEGLPSGAYNVSFDKSIMATGVMKEDFNDGTSTITIEFEPLEEVTEVTVTIL